MKTDTDSLLKFVQFNHGSYSAPAFKIYGQGSERQLLNAIRRAIRKEEKRAQK